jgi:exonuclease SbcD
MKFLHTSDWHIGRTIRGQSRRDEQERALHQLLTHAREQQVDCLLVAGDVFDTSAPTAESEHIVYGFFRDLRGAGIPAVVIAGNHDHPVRFEALSRLLGALDIHLVGTAKPPSDGGLVELQSRDGRETALIAAVPWIHEREAVDFAQLQSGQGFPLTAYAERVKEVLSIMTAPFRSENINVLVGHVLVNNAVVGKHGGERELHLDMGIYGVNPQMFPTSPQYTALGHVHKPQAARKSPPVHYSGSLLQLDFGEIEQDKSVNLVEIHPRLPAEITPLPITAGKHLYDIGSPEKGIAVAELPVVAAKYPQEETWLRVFIDVDVPVANLTSLVHAELPHAVTVQRARRDSAATERPSTEGLGPEELFLNFYRSDQGRGHEPSPESMTLFRQLLEEESRETAQA